jgi:uncharacterized ion transporter superfamily protein YfcC
MLRVGVAASSKAVWQKKQQDLYGQRRSSKHGSKQSVCGERRWLVWSVVVVVVVVVAMGVSQKSWLVSGVKHPRQPHRSWNEVT